MKKFSKIESGVVTHHYFRNLIPKNMININNDITVYLMVLITCTKIGSLIHTLRNWLFCNFPAYKRITFSTYVCKYATTQSKLPPSFTISNVTKRLLCLCRDRVLGEGSHPYLGHDITVLCNAISFFLSLLFWFVLFLPNHSPWWTWWICPLATT